MRTTDGATAASSATIRPVRDAVDNVADACCTGKRALTPGSAASRRPTAHSGTDPVPRPGWTRTSAPVWKAA